MKTINAETAPIPRLINAAHCLASTEQPLNLVSAPFSNGKQRIDAKVANQLRLLVESIGGQKQIIVTSGYRSFSEQQILYTDSLERNGSLYTEKYIARPGCSEHQTGLAVDLGFADTENDAICPSFEGRVISQKLLAVMALYGFILRYPKGKEAVTGIAYEPWHFRYVGRPHSDIICRNNWTLEEYHECLRQRGTANDKDA
ncbi:D-alanyl-D-alanine carboxypeptidase family protein [Enterococcus larvae]|uniref:D-alanyl-D-alanine carboxypeptidase family protein n=1 Tax=Enterococcus larvae TaxID=2794352 RepID=UPI003F36EFF9